MTQGFKEQLRQKLAQKKASDGKLREERKVEAKEIADGIWSENKDLLERNITPIVEEIVCPTLGVFKDVVASFHGSGSLIKSDSSISSSERGLVFTRTTLRFNRDFYINDRRASRSDFFISADPEFTEHSEKTLLYQPMRLSIIVSSEIIKIEAGEKKHSQITRKGPPRFEGEVSIAGKDFKETKILVEKIVAAFAVDKFFSMGCPQKNYPSEFDESFYSAGI